MKKLLTIILLMISSLGISQDKKTELSLGFGGNYSFFSNKEISNQYGGIQEIEFKMGFSKKSFDFLFVSSYGQSQGRSNIDRELEELFDLQLSSLDLKIFQAGGEVRPKLFGFFYFTIRGGTLYLEEYNSSETKRESSWGEYFGMGFGLTKTWPTQMADFSPFIEYGGETFMLDQNLISGFDGEIKQSIKFGFLFNPY